MSSRRAEFIAGMKATIPLEIGGLPFGIIFGALAISVGLSIPATMAMSIFVFAGSAQFIALGLIADKASLPVIVLATFIINLRHALYSATLAPHVKRLPQRWLIPLGYLLTDEAFVIAINRYNQPDDATYKHWYFLGSALSMFVSWQFFTWIGIFAGTKIPDPARFGLDFAMSVTFIGMLVPMLKNRPMLAAAVVAGVVAVLTYPQPNKVYLILAALAGIAAGVIVEAMQPAPEFAPEESAG